MRLTKMSWENYRGLADGEIIFNGADAVISGRNGAGKSSIASVLPFVLFGAEADKVKHYEGGLTPTDDGLIHAAQIEFDDGLTLRREYFWKGKGNTHKLYIDGEPVSQSEFKSRVDNLTHGGGELVINPFAFSKMKTDSQRALLMKLFGTSQDILSQPQFAEVAKILGGKTVGKFIVDTKRAVDYYQKEAATFAPAIRELELRLEDTPQGNVAELERQRQKLERQRADLIGHKPTDEELKLQAEIEKLHEERAILKATAPQDFSGELRAAEAYLKTLYVNAKDSHEKQLADVESRLQELREEYKAVSTSKAGICPTCGQTIPLEKFKAQRDEKLAGIVERGKLCNEKVTELKKILADVDADIAETTAHIGELKTKIAAQATENSTRGERIDDIERKMRELNGQIDALKEADKISRRGKADELDRQIADIAKEIIRITQGEKIQQRIEQLRGDEKEVNKKIAAFEHELAVAKQFLRDEIALIEGQINGRFKLVKFKLFDFLITTGEAKPTCEATLDGVPFNALSTGEKLKAALDIFRTLQGYYRTELPLIIDNAESYTAETLGKMPNQKMLLRVDESKLVIRVAEGRIAA